jgi:hypothetical protein
MAYTKQDCVAALKEAKEILGRSPECRVYREELDISPSYSTICNKFGTWDEAKEAAGLEKYGRVPREYCSKPSIIDMSREQWIELTSNKRQYLKRRAKLDRIQLNQGCQRCGYDSNARALQFHHRNRKEKEFSISSAYINTQVNWDETKKEIKKCDVLCANCHAIVESNRKLV